VCKCVLYYCHRVSNQLQLSNISYHIISISHCWPHSSVRTTPVCNNTKYSLLWRYLWRYNRVRLQFLSGKCVGRNMYRNYTETYLRTPCSVILWEKLISQFVTALSTFYETEALLPLSRETATTPCSGQLNPPHVHNQNSTSYLLSFAGESCIALAAVNCLFNIGDGGPLMVAQWLRYCATNRKVAGSIPDGVIGIFHWHNASDRTMALGSTQPLTEISTRSISWG
jgi:hypothetical protein